MENVPNPTSEELAQHRLTAFKGIEVGLGHTVKMRPLVAQLDEALNDEKYEKAEALARDIKARAESVIGYCMHRGR